MDLRALQGIQEAGRSHALGPVAGVGTLGQRVLLFGTDATAAELRTWWKERGLIHPLRGYRPPLALAPESARAYGVRGQPVAVIVDAGGRVGWAKEGYTPGDEAEWQLQLERMGG